MWVSSANTECSHWGPAGSCINSLSAARLQCHAGGDIVLGLKHLNWMDSGKNTGCIISFLNFPKWGTNKAKIFGPRTLYLAEIFAPLGQYPPLQPWRVHYLLISRPKKTMAQCRVSPRAACRVSACPGTMLPHTKSPDRWWAENRLRTRLQGTDIFMYPAKNVKNNIYTWNWKCPFKETVQIFSLCRKIFGNIFRLTC